MEASRDFTWSNSDVFSTYSSRAGKTETVKQTNKAGKTTSKTKTGKTKTGKKRTKSLS